MTNFNDLGPYAVSIQDMSNTTDIHHFAIDTSFEPYRREAFRHKSIPAQRQSIQMTNITGEGTVNTEGLWRREQTEWSMGAGQFSLDRKGDAQETRFLNSKGVDVFSYPLQATLLPDTYRKDSGTVGYDLLAIRCNGYVVTSTGSTVTAYDTSWAPTTLTFDTSGTQTHGSTPNLFTFPAFSAPSVVYSITSNDTYIYAATDTGLWFCNLGNSGPNWYTPSTVFEPYAANDITLAQDGTTLLYPVYTMVRWANDQLIASAGARLFAFQPRTALSFPFFGVTPTISDISKNIVNINATTGQQGGYNIVSGTTVTGNNYVTLISVAQTYRVAKGMAITGAGIQTGTTVTDVDYTGGTQKVYISLPCTASASGVSFTVLGGVLTGIVTSATPHNLLEGQSITVQNSTTQATIYSAAYSSGTMTIATSPSGTPPLFGHGLSVGESFTITSSTLKDSGVVKTVVDNYTFTYDTTLTSNGGYTTGSYSGIVTGTGAYGFNADYTVTAIIDTNRFIVLIPTNLSEVQGYGGQYISSNPPDMLITHQNPNWVWSDATGGETQVYFSGYVSGTHSGNGCIYRSSLLGSSTTSSTGVQSITTTSVSQPFNLDVPVQALPMSPDEYPVCIQSYLNYIFIGTNRGIRMTQTLSVYDPTATALGDLKSGPLIPNILQPVTSPVSAIIGDGRYVWFAWSDYDATSTGLGRLDLGTFIAGDPLAPAYASDIMVTGSGSVNSLVWDNTTNTPLMAIGGLGVYGPYSTNNGGVPVVTQYVPSGTITSGTFDYGIPDPKIPMFFDFGAVATGNSYVTATVTPEPNDPSLSSALGVYTIPSPTESVIKFTSGGPTEFDIISPVTNSIVTTSSKQFQTKINLYAGSSNTVSPVLHRWTLKSWPTVVQGTMITVVVGLFSIQVVDGMEVYSDPYKEFKWLEDLRTTQTPITYTEGPLSALGVIDLLDLIPHKRRDNFENGFEGDCVISIKTLAPYQYNPPSTT